LCKHLGGGIYFKKRRAPLAQKVTLKTEARRESIAAHIMIYPTIISFFIFLYIPFGNAIQLGFYKYTGLTGRGGFAGLSNYIQVLTDPLFFMSMFHTFQLALAGVCVSIPLGFLLAYVLYTGVPGGRAFHIALFIPYLISMVVVGSIWRIIYDPNIGPINQILKQIGLGNLAAPWLSRLNTALPAIAITWIWRSTPFNMMVMYANILKMPGDFLEAADIDGANTFQKIIYVVVPYLGPVFGALFMLAVTYALRLFDLVWVMTNGGPAGATEVMTSYIYRQSFVLQNFGTGTAASLCLMIIMVTLMGALTLVKWLRREKES
jgi:raffinose/stachyose/melibiose transport system permease protein